MELNIGIPKQQLKECTAMLNTLLADEFLLYTKLLNYHWNIVSPNFDPMHLFFKRLYEAQLDVVDDVAERVRTLGAPAFGTMQEYTQRSQLKEEPGVVPAEQQMIKNLLADHEAIIRTIRIDQQKAMDTYNDVGTNNFLIDLMEKHEKTAWMLRSFLVVK
jgi:starvation-inducible DNA-binding protein